MKTPESYSANADSYTHRIHATIFRLALFASGALLFIIQPLVARMIIPVLGGTPAVWNTCIFFFQAALLVGYLYSHFGSVWLGVRGHLILHIFLLCVALILLPIELAVEMIPFTTANPALAVSWALALAVGLPFVLIAATSPTLQNWFAHTEHPSARDPYFLYMASNLGSLAGLLSYPILLEPNFVLSTQSWIWTWGYMLLLILLIPCGLLLWRSTIGTAPNLQPQREFTESPIPENQSHNLSLTYVRRMKWLGLSFIPATLLPSVTSYLSADIAAVPFLWVLPLSLYLISFVLVFAKKPVFEYQKLTRVLHLLILGSAITIFSKATQPTLLLAVLHLATFFAIALTSHDQLAKDRPSTRYLTEYYLWLSLGGVLGGFLNAFVAPWIFTSVEEYPMAMILAAWLLLRQSRSSSLHAVAWLDFIYPALLGILTVALTIGFQKSAINSWLTHFLIFGFAGITCLSFSRRPTRFALGLCALMLGSKMYGGPYGEVLHNDRSFYGVYRVMVDKDKQFRYFFHGTTLHGAQNLDSNYIRQPLAYYYPTGPIGRLFAALAEENTHSPVAVVGLGTGSLACYRQRGQEYIFYEIDPLVAKLASDVRFFSFLRHCGHNTRIIFGDARISLKSAARGFYGLIILDAFSGDAIPIHLLTREAVTLYLEKLAPTGLLAFHVSSRHFDLLPIVGRLGKELGLSGVVADDSNLSPFEKAAGKLESRWVILGRTERTLSRLRQNAMWNPLPTDLNTPVWTDNYSNILPVLRW